MARFSTGRDFGFDFRGRQVLITGGTSGIGAAAARAFRNAGARVLACAADEAELARAGEDPGFAGIETRRMDVTRSDEVRAVMAGIGGLDALVCSAGLALRDNEYQEEGFERVMDVNVGGSMHVLRAAVPLLAANGGAAVLLASMTSFWGSARMPAYAASKAAIRSLTQSLAARHAPQGVRINAVAPGWIATPMSRPGREDPAWREAIERRTPMARWGEPEEVADPILFLCSRAARFVTGAVLPVDGGFSAVI